MDKKYYIIYNKENAEDIKKLVVDFKNIGMIIIRQELGKKEKFDLKSLKVRENGQKEIDENSVLLFYMDSDVEQVSMPKGYEQHAIYIYKGVKAGKKDSSLLLDELYDNYYKDLLQASEPEKANEYIELFRIKSIQNDLDKDTELLKFLDKYGETKNYLTLKANTIYRRKQFKEARELMDKALTITLNDPRESFEYAILLEDYYEEYGKACKYYERAIELDKKFYEAYFNLGVIYAKHFNDYVKAEKYYDMLIEADIADEKVYYNKAIIIMKITGNVEEAICSYKKAIEIDPKHFSAYNNLANLYLKELNDPDKAKECYEKAIDITPQDFGVHFNLGNIYKSCFNDYEKAKECYENSIKVEDNIYARMNLAILLEENFDDYNGAIENLNKVLEFQPNNITIMNQIASIYELVSDYENALKFYEKILEYKVDDASAKYNMARMRQKM
ncbi:MAG TPA: hypothetical protein DEP72_01685 [Clostridiales bacterium]|nr:MAG: hypothetical protein A2Y18_07600 [Clostridiales bacterium GWD2_32_19]HCC06865.1 hypothetical protein [Clostridiales bacterium]